ncbi:hypothetical protein TWF481_003509 [Arthrobotrys musiformis]|uniref:Uncharacterized protein n=1 Tax=Arthrobotrys musiformis TaxID=47236 RepID=A0AAV9VRK3_9PEZI
MLNFTGNTVKKRKGKKGREKKKKKNKKKKKKKKKKKQSRFKRLLMVHGCGQPEAKYFVYLST